MSKSLLDLKNSLAVVARVEDHPDILFTPFMLEEIILIMSPQYHLARRDEIRFKDLADEPVVMKELGSGTRKLVEQAARNEKIKLNINAQTGNMEFIKQLVTQKRALSFVVRSAVAKELARGELVSLPIRGHRLILDIFIAQLRDYELPETAGRFFHYLLSVTQPENLPLGIAGFQKRLTGSPSTQGQSPAL